MARIEKKVVFDAKITITFKGEGIDSIEAIKELAGKMEHKLNTIAGHSIFVTNEDDVQRCIDAFSRFSVQLDGIREDDRNDRSA